jgi:hypothetical protein
MCSKSNPVTVNSGLFCSFVQFLSAELWKPPNILEAKPEVANLQCVGACVGLTSLQQE